MEKIHQAVTEIWVPQVWQPPTRPPARTVTTIPLQPGGLRGKNEIEGQSQSSPQLIGILTVLRCIFVPNVEIFN